MSITLQIARKNWGKYKSFNTYVKPKLNQQKFCLQNGETKNDSRVLFVIFNKMGIYREYIYITGLLRPQDIIAFFFLPLS